MFNKRLTQGLIVGGIAFVSILAGSLYGHIHVNQFSPITASFVRAMDKDAISNPGLYVPVLMYHHIAAKTPQQTYFVSPQTLDAQFQWLKDNGYNVISYQQFYQGLRDPKLLPAKPVVITFDDGDEDQYVNALPVLKKYNYTATFFIISGKVGTKDFMTWPQLAELVKSGMSVEGHTVTHPNLAHQTTAKVIQELQDSKKTLEDHLGIKVDFMAYPGGSFDNRTVAQAKNTGYLSAMTTVHSVYHKVTTANDYYRITRIHIDDELPTFIRLVQGKHESLIEH